MSDRPNGLPLEHAVQQIPEGTKGRPRKVKKHSMPRKPYAAFQALCRSLNISPKKACEMLGYASTTWQGWQADGVPFVVQQALHNEAKYQQALKPPAPIEPPPAPLVAVYCVRPSTKQELDALVGFLDLAKLPYVVA
jgi:hypothetical protein